jgi:hypothetical protein
MFTNKLKEKIEVKNGLENYLYNLKNTMVKRDDSPAILEEIKVELDPIIDEGIKWLEENDKAETDVYKEKQKELEGKVNPLMQKLYSQAGGVPSMNVSAESAGNDDDEEDDDDDAEDAGGDATGTPKIDELD